MEVIENGDYYFCNTCEETGGVVLGWKNDKSNHKFKTMIIDNADAARLFSIYLKSYADRLSPIKKKRIRDKKNEPSRQAAKF